MTELASANSDTRQRLLDAAGEVFAERGFEKATIREIVKRANANLNAVNYYFRDKHGLYRAVFEHVHHFALEKDHAEFQRMRSLPPDERLRAFICHMLRSFSALEHEPWHTRLMVREMTEPTGALDIMIDRVIQPRFREVVSIVRDLAQRETPLLRLQLCAESILAQCVHISHARPIVSRLIPDLTDSAETTEAVADHIAEFSLAAIRNLNPKETHP